MNEQDRLNPESDPSLSPEQKALYADAKKLKVFDEDFPSLREVFPHSWIFVQDHSLSQEECDRIIKLFEESKHRYQGVTGTGRADLAVKNSLDLKIEKEYGIEYYEVDALLFQKLNKSLIELQQFAPEIAPRVWNNDTGYQVQRTDPGGQYVWHIDGSAQGTFARQLVFMWYLNEPEEGGCTGFKYQGIQLKPRTGRLVFFPPFWTHLHACMPVVKGSKYIVTGWIWAKQRGEDVRSVTVGRKK